MSEPLDEIFKQTHFRFSRMYSRFMEQEGLTLQQYTVLNMLHDMGPLPMNQIGQALSISKPAVTYLVDQLEEKKLLGRCPCEEDRRVIRLVLKPKGEQKVARAQKLAIDVMNEALAELPNSDRAKIGKFYQVMVSNMDRYFVGERNE